MLYVMDYLHIFNILMVWVLCFFNKNINFPDLSFIYFDKYDIKLPINKILETVDNHCIIVFIAVFLMTLIYRTFMVISNICTLYYRESAGIGLRVIWFIKKVFVLSQYVIYFQLLIEGIRLKDKGIYLSLIGLVLFSLDFINYIRINGGNMESNSRKIYLMILMIFIPMAFYHKSNLLGFVVIFYWNLLILSYVKPWLEILGICGCYRILSATYTNLYLYICKNPTSEFRYFKPLTILFGPGYDLCYLAIKLIQSYKTNDYLSSNNILVQLLFVGNIIGIYYGSVGRVIVIIFGILICYIDKRIFENRYISLILHVSLDILLLLILIDSVY